MNPIEEKENIENQEEQKEESPKEEEKEKEETNEVIKEGDQIGGDILNLEAENESSIEAKEKGEEKDAEENKEEGKEENSFKSGEEGKMEEGEQGAEGEGEGEEGQISDLDAEIKMNEQKQREIEIKTREKTLESVKLQYKYKLSLIEKMDEFQQIFDKYWNLLPKTFEGDITKESFIKLITKILKVLLPIFNYSQIPKYCNGVWTRYVKGKPTMTREIFEKVIFKLTHIMSVHVNHFEYQDTLNLIYDRITCIRKYSSNGEEQVYYPSIKVTLYNPLSKEEYQNCTWEIMNGNIALNELFEEFGEGEEENSEEKQNQENEEEEKEKEKKRKIRPRLKIINDFVGESNESKEIKKDENVIKPNSYYETDKNMFLYSEDIFYAEKEEIDKSSQELNCHINYELMDDSELIIYGYPTQYILSKFINEMKDLEELKTEQNSDYDSTFFITDYPQY